MAHGLRPGTGDTPPGPMDAQSNTEPPSCSPPLQPRAGEVLTVKIA